MKTVGLYIHFPFCVKKCNYCDFLSFPAEDCCESLCRPYSDDINTPCDSEFRSDFKTIDEMFSFYIKCVQNELLLRLPLLENTKIISIFFGGGTPSLMAEENITSLMAFLYGHLTIAPDAEITIECNPGTISFEKLQAMKAAGINRLSIGLQSTQNDELKYLGRIHTFETFLENYENARRAGFTNINIDLMSALPGQTVASYKETIKKILALRPEHISAYSLIIEEGTKFWDLYGKDTCNATNFVPLSSKNPAVRGTAAPLPSEDDEREMYYLTRKLLHEHGYERYELSNYAKPGYECRHNKIYWTLGDYLGIGLGSSSLMNQTRFSNITDLKDYLVLWKKHSPLQCQKEAPLLLNESPAAVMDIQKMLLQMEQFPSQTGIESFESLSAHARMEEFMFLGLRLTDGICADAFEKMFGCSVESVYGDIIQKHIDNKTLIFDKNRLKLTAYGQDIANYVMSDFIFDCAISFD